MAFRNPNKSEIFKQTVNKLCYYLTTLSAPQFSRTAHYELRYESYTGGPLLSDIRLSDVSLFWTFTMNTLYSSFEL